MPESNRTPAIQKFGKIALAVIAPLFLISLSIAPLLSALQSSDTQGGLSPELIQEEIEGYQAVLEREPDNRVALTGLIDLGLQSNNLDVALEPLEKLVELEPEDLSLGLLLARVRLQSGDATGAVAQYEALLEQNPDNQQISQELLSAKIRSGDTEGAIALLQERLEADPESVDIRRDLAATYVQANQPQAAIPIYDELIAQDPTDYSYLMGKGMALSVAAEDEETQAEAQDLFARALQLAPPQQREQVEQISQFYSQLASINANNQIEATEDPVEATPTGEVEDEVEDTETSGNEPDLDSAEGSN